MEFAILFTSEMLFICSKSPETEKSTTPMKPLTFIHFQYLNQQHLTVADFHHNPEQTSIMARLLRFISSLNCSREMNSERIEQIIPNFKFDFSLGCQIFEWSAHFELFSAPSFHVSCFSLAASKDKKIYSISWVCLPSQRRIARTFLLRNRREKQLSNHFPGLRDSDVWYR